MDDCNCTKLSGKGVDLETPRNEILTPFYKRSFAHHTVKERMPTIITQVLDSLVRNKEEIGRNYGKAGLEELKLVIGELSKLKYQIQTNKPITKIVTDAEDAKVYNQYLKVQLDKNGICTYFNTVWLHAECYMYRRIREIFELTTLLKEVDPFAVKKQLSFEQSLGIMSSMSETLQEMLNEDEERNRKLDFVKLLKCSLWSNKCDLSLSNGEVDKTPSVLNVVEDLESNIICDQSDEVWEAANLDTRFQIIDIVLDNVGYELFCDLCLADYIISKNLAQSVRFYVKSIPWFISDVTKSDFHWTLLQLKSSNLPRLQSLAEKWSDYLGSAQWTIEENMFWTLPLEYKHMYITDEILYRRMARAKLIIFKGDLNYRKLFGERNWDPKAPVVDCLEGFHPTRVCTLRTLKADIVCGLDDGVAQKTSANDPEWMVSGNYGVVQYSGKVVRLI